VAGKRWDGDDRGAGVANAGALVPGASELLLAMGLSGWVAEEPETHLLPHLVETCSSLEFALLGAAVDETGTFVVRLRWTGPWPGPAAIRAAVFGLIGSVAESCCYVRQHPPGDRSAAPLVFDVCTGSVAGDSRFEPHGHTLRLSVEP
jgi:hypothetical protein